MRPPWIEAAALLGVRGGAIPINLRQQRPYMPAETQYALIKTPIAKPFVCASLGALARRIHSERGEAAIDLDPKLATIYPAGPMGVKGLLCVRVYQLGLDGNREKDLGYAYLEGNPESHELLTAELYRQRPRQFARAS